MPKIDKPFDFGAELKELNQKGANAYLNKENAQIQEQQNKEGDQMKDEDNWLIILPPLRGLNFYQWISKS